MRPCKNEEAMVRDQDLDFWIKHNYNVLFVGHAGVGKTSIVKDAFNRNGFRWKYFSASTMDPWVDLIGVPKEQKEADGTPYLDLVRPKEFQKDEIDAVFFDEFNRSHKKVRNACMELLQFKSINGKKYNNLRLIWAAINPDEEGDYDVEKLDPAQEDRFHIKVQVPYKPERSYFIRNYGEDMAKAAISWWEGIPAEQKMKVSPRRLDYALSVFKNNGDMRYVLPEASNVSKLVLTLKHGPISEALQKFMDAKDVVNAKAFLSQENNYAAALDWLVKRKDRLEFFLPAMALEKVSTLMAGYKTAMEAALEVSLYNNEIRDLINNVMAANQNKNLSNKLRKHIKQSKGLTSVFSTTKNAPLLGVGATPDAPVFETTKSVGYNYGLVAKQYKAYTTSGQYYNTQHRKTLFMYLCKQIPQTMTTEDAVLTLEFLGWIAKHSHQKTLLGMKGFMGVFNHCIDRIARNENLSYSDIEKKYNGRVLGLLYDIANDAILSQKMYWPTGSTILEKNGKIGVAPSNLKVGT